MTEPRCRICREDLRLRRGVCVRCGKAPHKPNGTRCHECARAHADRELARYYAKTAGQVKRKWRRRKAS